MRSYQPNVNKPTEALSAQVLKDLTEKKENNMAIDAYRKAMREMEEATAHKVLNEFVAGVIQTQEYQAWQASELKKDEHRRKKKMPADDLHRVKLYISLMKSGLPAVILTTNFTESTDRWGRTGLWRVQSNGYLTGLAVLDADHVPNVEARVDE